MLAIERERERGKQAKQSVIDLCVMVSTQRMLVMPFSSVSLVLWHTKGFLVQKHRCCLFTFVHLVCAVSDASFKSHNLNWGDFAV